jgi:hypothetical protein
MCSAAAYMLIILSSIVALKWPDASRLQLLDLSMLILLFLLHVLLQEAMGAKAPFLHMSCRTMMEPKRSSGSVGAIPKVYKFRHNC